MDEYYEQIASFRTEDKVVRVKVNQTENELDHQIRRLDIICKSKGLPRPLKRATPANTGAKNTISPYRRNGVSPAQTRNLSNNGSSAKRPSPVSKNFAYTPPNRRAGINSYSPNGGSQSKQQI